MDVRLVFRGEVWAKDTCLDISMERVFETMRLSETSQRVSEQRSKGRRLGRAFRHSAVNTRDMRSGNNGD